MPDMNTGRKLAVAAQIESIKDPELRTGVNALYSILDSMEFFKVIPFSAGVLFMCFSLFLDKGGYPDWVLGLSAVLFFAVGVFLLRLIFLPLINRRVSRLSEFLKEHGDHGRACLDLLFRIDPSLKHNTRKQVARAFATLTN